MSDQRMGTATVCLTPATLPYAGPATHPDPSGGSYGDPVGEPWDADLPGVLTFPSGRRVLGRALGDPVPRPLPEFGVYLLGRPPPDPGWEQRWVRWRDFELPRDPADLRDALRTVRLRAAGERVEIACRGGTGRTGTALACLAVLDGVPAEESVAFVRRHYRPRAVETRSQRAFVIRFAMEG
jgi:hypothetical protein